MYVLMSQVDLRPGSFGDFMAAVEEMHRASLEGGSLEILQIVQDDLLSDRLMVYEAHSSRAGWEEHRSAAHYLAFDARTRGLLKQPPTVICEGLLVYPEVEA
jgi:quinol monooxygenase YgiN